MTLNPFKPFHAYLLPYYRRIVWGLVLLVVVEGISAGVPLLVKWAIDTTDAALSGGGEADVPVTVRTVLDAAAEPVALIAVVIAALGLLQMLLSVVMRWNFASASRFVERDVRRLYVTHLLRLPLSFFQSRRVGDLMARASNDVEAIERFLSHGFRMSLQALLNFVISLTLMCAIDWQLALLALLPMPILAVSARWVSGRVRRGFRQVQEQFAAMSARIQENLSGIRVIKAFARGDLEAEEFGQLNQEYVARFRTVVNIEAAFYPFTFMLSGVSLVLILWQGGIRVVDGTLGLGAFVAFNAFLLRMSRPMMFLGRLVDRYQRAMASMMRIEAILREEPQILDAPSVAYESAANPVSVDSVRGEVEFRNASFVYNGKPALTDVSVRVPAGRTLAIVGRVGSGKSTLARLIPQLIRGDSGQVLIDGTPVEEIPLAVARGAVGYVPQETFLFSETIRQNIALGTDDGEATGAQVAEAAEVAQLGADLKAIPGGLEAVVGERGVTLSGGQKQRTALARAVIRAPKILILDDALASVDTRTEEEILKRLRRVMDTRTTIIIAHRISTVKDADHIIVLGDGEIAEQGSHEELVAIDGIYADMFRRQHLTRELDELK